MANPQLIAYIQENLSKFSKEAVIQSLSSAGWSAVDISAAFMDLEHPAPVAPIVPPAPIVSAEPAQQRPIGSVEPRPAVASASAAVTVSNSADGGAPQRVGARTEQISSKKSEYPEAATIAGGSAQIIPRTQISNTAAATNPNDVFLAEMTKRRKEAEGLNTQTSSQGDVTFAVGATQSPVVTQGGLIGMVLKTGLVKTEQQANIVLIGVVVVCLGLSLWFIL